MYFVYILESELDKSFYIGYTSNIENRVHEHNFGRTGYTKLMRPWKLVYKKEFEVKSEAIKYERYLKRLKSKIYIVQLINKATTEGP